MLEQGEGWVWNGKHICQEWSYFGCLWRRANWIKEGKIKRVILLHSQLISTSQFEFFRIWKHYGPLWIKINYSGFQADLTVFSVSRGNSENLVRHPVLIKCPAQFCKFRRFWPRPDKLWRNIWIFTQAEPTLQTVVWIVSCISELLMLQKILLILEA